MLLVMPISSPLEKTVKMKKIFEKASRNCYIEERNINKPLTTVDKKIRHESHYSAPESSQCERDAACCMLGTKRLLPNIHRRLEQFSMKQSNCSQPSDGGGDKEREFDMF